MEVNLENLFVAIGYTPPSQLVRPLILLSQSDLFHSKISLLLNLEQLAMNCT